MVVFVWGFFLVVVVVGFLVWFGLVFLVHDLSFVNRPRMANAVLYIFNQEGPSSPV